MAELTPRLIPLMLMLPLIGGILLAFLPRGNDRGVRGLALIWSLLTFAVSIVLLASFDYARAGELQFLSRINWIDQFGLSFGFGVDSVSLWLVMLTTFLMPIVVLGSFGAVTTRVKEFFLWLLVLEAAMIGTFVATDLIFFYICFEFTLVPLYFMIGIFGSSERLKAARVFFLYTFTGSMLTFAGILYVAWYNQSLTGTWSFNIEQLTLAAQALIDRPVTLNLLLFDIRTSAQHLVLLTLLAGFAVKVPLFPVHTWLPLAHTEAPTAGSVILAGVLLKLGTYGLLRLALPMCPEAVVDLAPAIGLFAVIGILYTGLICWVQQDIKKLIAYSSVSHLGFCVMGMFALNLIGLNGSVMYMINHGLSTGALFLCVGMIYERFHTREMAKLGGLGRAMPIWASFMVFFVLASVGLPGLNGFVGEFLTLLGAFTSDYTLGFGYAAAAGVGMIIGAIYLLYMVGRVVWGPVNIPADHGHHAGDAHGHDHPKVKDLNAREIITLLPLVVGCLWLGLYPKPVMDSLNPTLEVRMAAAREVIEARQKAALTIDDDATIQPVAIDAAEHEPTEVTQ